MLARNSDLYFDVSASSAAFSSSARRACSTSLFLRSTSTFCSASCLRLQRQLLVGLLELGLPRLQLDRQLLRLLQQVLGPHRRLDRVEHDADRLGQLLEEREVGRGERLERRELDDRLGLALEEHREHDDVLGFRRAEAGVDSACSRAGTLVSRMRCLSSAHCPTSPWPT